MAPRRHGFKPGPREALSFGRGLDFCTARTERTYKKGGFFPTRFGRKLWGRTGHQPNGKTGKSKCSSRKYKSGASCWGPPQPREGGKKKPRANQSGKKVCLHGQVGKKTRGLGNTPGGVSNRTAKKGATFWGRLGPKRTPRKRAPVCGWARPFTRGAEQNGGHVI